MNYMTTVTPQSNAERIGDWSQKAWLSGYDFMTGPKLEPKSITKQNAATAAKECK